MNGYKGQYLHYKSYAEIIKKNLQELRELYNKLRKEHLLLEEKYGKIKSSTKNADIYSIIDYKTKR